MKPRDIFGLTIRFIGLLGILYVVNHMNFVWHKSGALFVWHKTGAPYEHGIWQFLFEVVLILIGLFMVFGCPILMRLMFPKDKSGSDDDKSSSG